MSKRLIIPLVVLVTALAIAVGGVSLTRPHAATHHVTTRAPLTIPAHVQFLPNTAQFLPANGCRNGGIAVFRDANFGIPEACFPPGDYYLGNVCMVPDGYGGCMQTWMDQISSFTNLWGNHSGYFYSDASYCMGVVGFSAGSVWSWVGSGCNDSFYYLHVSN